MGSQGYYIKDNDTEVKEEIKNPETKETQNLNNEIKETNKNNIRKYY